MFLARGDHRRWDGSLASSTYHALQVSGRKSVGALNPIAPLYPHSLDDSSDRNAGPLPPAEQGMGETVVPTRLPTPALSPKFVPLYTTFPPLTLIASYDLRSTRASSNFDQRHMLNVAYIYDLPFFRKSPWKDSRRDQARGALRLRCYGRYVGKLKHGATCKEVNDAGRKVLERGGYPQYSP